MELNDLKYTKATIEAFSQYIVDEYKKRLTDNKPGRAWNSIASHKLINSINTNYNYNGKTVRITIMLEDYWKYLDDGIKSGTKVPVNALIDWIRVKPVIPRQLPNGNLPTEKQLAFMIRQKIYKDGTKPMHFMSDTIEEAVGKFTDALKEAVKKDFNEIMYVKLTSALV